MGLYIIDSNWNEVQLLGYTGPLTIPRPSCANGDVLLAFLGSWENDGFSAPAGWSYLHQVSNADSGVVRQCAVFMKQITNVAGEPATYSWYNISGGATQGIILTIRSTIGAVIAEDSYAGTYQADNGYSIPTPSITTVRNYAMVFTFGGIAFIDALTNTVYNKPTGTGITLLFNQPPYGDAYWAYFGLAVYTNIVPGATGTKTWTITNGDPTNSWDNVSMQFALSEIYTPVGCTCHSICDNDCGSNQLCTGHVPSCSNNYSFTSVAIDSIIRASHLIELQTAINAERNNASRRYNASDPAYCYTHTPGNVACTNNDFSSYPWTSGVVADQIIYAQHMTDLKSANNTVTSSSGYGSTVTNTFSVDGIIYASHVTDLQNKINQTRNVCICDSHCNCNPSDCGCNGECPSDDYTTY